MKKDDVYKDGSGDGMDESEDGRAALLDELSGMYEPVATMGVAARKEMNISGGREMGAGDILVWRGRGRVKATLHKIGF